MKRVFLSVFSLLFIMMLVGCTTARLTAMFGPMSGYTFKGLDNPLYGYEGISWGANLETVKQKTGWYITESRKGKYYYIGVYTTDWYGTREDYYPHGDKSLYVDKTLLFFSGQPQFLGYDFNAGKVNYKTDHMYLYGVEDEYKKTPPIDFLKRYGGFSDENDAKSWQRADGIKAIYRGQNHFENFYSLEIVIYEDGRTVVKMHDPFFDVPMHNWIYYEEKDYKNKRINYTFLNQNTEGKYLFFGYAKGIEHANVSCVRAGVCWGGDKASGTYDLKGDSGVLSKKYSTEKWKCLYKDFSYTNIATESAREFVELFLTSKEVKVRHDNVVSEFYCSGNTLQERLLEYGITWEEIDAALLNEEF